MRSGRQLIARCGLVALVCVFAAPAAALEFAGHRAIYRITLEKAPSGGVSAVSGTMSIDWRNGCSGWTFEYHSIIGVTSAQGSGVRLATAATTWESSDGRQYRFNVRHSTNGRELQRLEGHAALLGPEGSGSVRFASPKGKVVPLPAGTLFPMAHSVAVMQAAETRSPPIFLPYNVFDGMDDEGLYMVNAVVGRFRGAGGRRPSSIKELRGRRAWPVTLAYFKAAGSEARPDHEIKLTMYDNGVADDLIMDFTDFSVRATLDTLELRPTPDCSR